jgi:hypothetical protein
MLPDIRVYRFGSSYNETNVLGSIDRSSIRGQCPTPGKSTLGGGLGDS